MAVSELFKGNKVKLAAIREEDYELLSKWYGDGYALRFFEMEPAYPRNSDSVKRWVQEQVSSGKQYSFAIRTVEDDILVGYIDLNSIVWSNGVATLSIGIGDKNSRGKGYASEAVNLILKFAFHELNLHRVQLCVISYNEPAIALYEKCGFKKEGTQREVVFRDGVRYDLHNYGILKHEWESKF